MNVSNHPIQVGLPGLVSICGVGLKRNPTKST